jgi:hypothetical protein
MEGNADGPFKFSCSNCLGTLTKFMIITFEIESLYVIVSSVHTLSRCLRTFHCVSPTACNSGYTERKYVRSNTSVTCPVRRGYKELEKYE